MVSNSITISSGEPQALFASKPTANSGISGTGTPVLGSATTGYIATSDNVLPTGSPTGTTSKSPAQTVFTSSASSCRKKPHLNVYSLIIVFFAFLHLATALDNNPGSTRNHEAINAPLLPRDMTPNPFSTSALMQRGEGSRRPIHRDPRRLGSWEDHDAERSLDAGRRDLQRHLLALRERRDHGRCIPRGRCAARVPESGLRHDRAADGPRRLAIGIHLHRHGQRAGQ